MANIHLEVCHIGGYEEKKYGKTSNFRQQGQSLYRQKIFLTRMTRLVGIQQSHKAIFYSREKVKKKKIIPSL